MSDSTYYVRARGKITGPFELAAVRKLVLRGTISRLDELSLDRVKWESAASNYLLFPPTLPQASPPGPQASPAGAAAPIDATNRYYYQQNGAALGPVPLSVLRHLANSGGLGPDDPVWMEGAGTSQQAQTILELAGHFSARSGVRRRRRSLAPLVATAAVLLITAGAVATAMWRRHAVQSSSLASASDGRPLVRSVNDEAAVARAVGLTVCGVHVITPDGKSMEIPASTGSCFAISPDGYLLTNRHVVEDTAEWINAKAKRDKILREDLRVVDPKVWVFFDGHKFVAQIVFLSAHFDTAILRIDRRGKPQPSFALSALPRTLRSEEVFAIGFPGIGSNPLSVDDILSDIKTSSTRAADVTEMFKKRDFSFTLTKGVVSRSVQETGGQTYVQHEAVIRHGNSGGPLVTPEGVVIAINTRLQGDQENIQTNMALEISQLRREIDEHVPNVLWQ